MPWLHEVRRPGDFPRDGRTCWVLRPGRAAALPALWDGEMGCFLGWDLSVFDEIMGWWPARAGEPEAWQDRLFDEMCA